VGALSGGGADGRADGGEEGVFQIERKPPVTLRQVAVGGRARSEPLLSGAIAG